MSAEQDPTGSNTSVEPMSARTWFVIFGVLLGLVFAVAMAALVKSYQSPSQHAPSGTSTWYCESPTGQQTAVKNIGNCGPLDLVGWCDIWKEDPNTGDGHCAG